MQDHPCVDLCCPHAHCFCWGSRKSGDGTVTLTSPFSQEFWTEHDMQMEDYGKEQGFILKAPKSKEKRFGCPHELYLDKTGSLPDFLWKSGGRPMSLKAGNFYLQARTAQNQLRMGKYGTYLEFYRSQEAPKHCPTFDSLTQSCARAHFSLPPVCPRFAPSLPPVCPQFDCTANDTQKYGFTVRKKSVTEI